MAGSKDAAPPSPAWVDHVAGFNESAVADLERALAAVANVEEMLGGRRPVLAAESRRYAAHLRDARNECMQEARAMRARQAA